VTTDRVELLGDGLVALEVSRLIAVSAVKLSGEKWVCVLHSAERE